MKHAAASSGVSGTAFIGALFLRPSIGLVFGCGIALLLASASAQAGFVVVEPPPPPKVSPPTPPLVGYSPLKGSAAFAVAGPFDSPVPSALKFVGAPPASIDVRRGLGWDMHLADALRLIAPPGWRGFGKDEIADTFAAAKGVSWKGGKPWTDVLGTLAKEQGLSIEVDWSSQRLYVGPRAAVSKPVTAPTAPLQPAVWAAKEGSSVRDTVEEWAKKANWTVVWDAGIDYPIVGGLRYAGGFLDAIRGIFLAHARAATPLRADVYTRQHLIHITE